MTLSLLLIWAIATVGLTNIIVHGVIFDVLGKRWLDKGIRPWLKEHMDSDWFQLFECYECSGFWSGLITGVFICSYLGGWYWLFILLFGWAGSVLSQTYTETMEFMRSKIEFIIEDKNGQ